MINLAVINEKGGVGKTTTAINLSAGLAKSGYRVLLVDLDPQANSTTGSGLNWRDYAGSSVGESLLVHNPDFVSCVVPLPRDGMKIVPATRQLRDMAHELVAQGEPLDRVSTALRKIEEEYDYAVLDLPPTLEILQENAIEAATRFIIPVELAAFSLDGLGELIQHLHRRKAKAEDWQFRILLSRVAGFSKAANEAARKDMGPLAKFLLSSAIRFNGKIQMSQREGKDILAYAPSSRGARDFRALTREVIRIWPAKALQTT